MCVYNTYKGRGCWTDPGQGLGAEPGGWSLGAGECWGTRGLAGWLAEVGAGAGPGWPIENALKAATFQKQKKKQKKAGKKAEKKHKKKAKTGAGKKENDFVFLCFFCGTNCDFFCVFFVV